MKYRFSRLFINILASVLAFVIMLSLSAGTLSALADNGDVAALNDGAVLEQQPDEQQPDEQQPDEQQNEVQPNEAGIGLIPQLLLSLPLTGDFSQFVKSAKLTTNGTANAPELSSPSLLGFDDTIYLMLALETLDNEDLTAIWQNGPDFVYEVAVPDMLIIKETTNIDLNVRIDGVPSLFGTLHFEDSKAYFTFNTANTDIFSEDSFDLKNLWLSFTCGLDKNIIDPNARQIAVSTDPYGDNEYTINLADNIPSEPVMYKSGSYDDETGLFNWKVTIMSPETGINASDYVTGPFYDTTSTNHALTGGVKVTGKMIDTTDPANPDKNIDLTNFTYNEDIDGSNGILEITGDNGKHTNLQYVSGSVAYTSISGEGSNTLTFKLDKLENQSATFYVTSKVKDQNFMNSNKPGGGSFTNNVGLTATPIINETERTDLPVSGSASATKSLPNNILRKTTGSYDYDKHTVEWIIEVNSDEIDEFAGNENDGVFVTDIIPNGQELVTTLGDVVEINGIKNVANCINVSGADIVSAEAEKVANGATEIIINLGNLGGKTATLTYKTEYTDSDLRKKEKAKH